MKEAIANLNHLYGMVAPDIQRSLDVAIKALERPSGDLISREALKDIAYINKGNFNTVEGIREWIDNAPTVNTNAIADNEKSQGDLISREALRKEVTEKVNFTTVDGHIAYDKMLKLIDNAQAVGHSLLPLSGEADNSYMRGYEVGKAEGILKAETRPKGEWISRSVLDEIRQLYKDYQPNLATEVIEFGNALEKLIDNVPTVPIPNEQIAWEQGYEAGLSQGKQDRPKGEWKTVEGYDGDEYYECSNCGEPWFLSAGTPKDNNMNFCPNCGADMRGGDVI